MGGVTSREERMLILGLAGAGKTRLAQGMVLGNQFNDAIGVIPTIAMGAVSFKYKNINYTLWDMKDTEEVRPLWRHYYQNATVVVFVVDSTNKETLEEAGMILNKLVREEELKDCPFLIMANKQDTDNSMSADQVRDGLGISEAPIKNWHIEGTSAVTGEGVVAGLDWLSDVVNSKQ
mmetsp:Transcript_30648/g.34203  ORF Transcript_30648/g.34203 Transcript_30648/m.34203 type:complete len:177 (-) Transcript_30648:20-550(-)